MGRRSGNSRASADFFLHTPLPPRIGRLQPTRRAMANPILRSLNDLRATFGQEVEIAAALGDPETQFYALLNFGSVKHVLEQYASALEIHSTALTVARDLNHPILTALALQSMGEDYVRLGNRDEAEPCFQQALAIFRDSGMKSKVNEVEDYLKSVDNP